MTDRTELPPRSLLVVRLSSMGDVLHALPAVASLRTAHGPDVPIGWVVAESFREIVEASGLVDRVFAMPSRHGGGLARKARAARVQIAAIREFARDGVAIDFQGLMKSAALMRMSGASARYGFDRASIREWPAVLAVNHPVAPDRSRHVIEWNLSLAVAAGAHPGGVPAVDLRKLASDPDGSLGRLCARPSVVILPGAGQSRKLWDPDKWVELIRSITSTTDSEPLVVWGPGERDVASRIAEASGAALAPPTGIPGLAWLLANAAVVVGGDTGPIHLAAALGARVVGLYGPTSLRRNGPWGQEHRCVESPEGRMSSIAPAQVLQRVLEASGSPAPDGDR